MLAQVWNLTLAAMPLYGVGLIVHAVLYVGGAVQCASCARSCSREIQSGLARAAGLYLL